VVYATEQVAGKAMWVVDLIGADPSAKAKAEDAANRPNNPEAPGASR
jgi:hypothetical protein